MKEKFKLKSKLKNDLNKNESSSDKEEQNIYKKVNEKNKDKLKL